MLFFQKPGELIIIPLFCSSVEATEMPGDWESVNCTQLSNSSLCLPTPTPIPHYLNISKELPLEYARPM